MVFSVFLFFKHTGENINFDGNSMDKVNNLLLLFFNEIRLLEVFAFPLKSEPTKFDWEK